MLYAKAIFALGDSDLSDGFKEQFKRIDQELSRRQKHYSDEAIHLGFTREVFRTAGEDWLQVANSGSQTASAWSALDASRAIGDEIDALNHGTTVGGENRGIYSNALFFADSTGSAVHNATGRVHTTDAYQDLFGVLKNDEYYAACISRLDAALGKTYQAINEVVYGTTWDPYRAGLFLVRQAFDQFFGKLAPDDEVRSSIFWKPKDGGKPDQIHRRERIDYAAHKHAKDHAREGALAATAGHMLKVYEDLNDAHDRGMLDESQCRDAIRAMKSLLQEWIDGIA